jgi:hypothetical protein
MPDLVINNLYRMYTLQSVKYIKKCIINVYCKNGCFSVKYYIINM